MKKIALLIGINYFGSSGELSGCINDAMNMKALLEPLGYECRVMRDDKPRGDVMYPSRGKILTQMKALVRDGRSCSSLFLHYSGHGTSLRDNGRDEKDRRDEALCPAGGGVIRDDEMRRLVIDQLSARTRLMMLLDCCHSGTGSDLRYNYEDVSKCSTARRKRFPDEYVVEDWAPGVRRRVNQRNLDVKAKVLCISGCRDAQTSADTVFDNEACGAMTAMFLKAWEMARVEQSANISDILQHMSGMLKCYGYSQVPQLSTTSARCDIAISRRECTLDL